MPYKILRNLDPNPFSLTTCHLLNCLPPQKSQTDSCWFKFCLLCWLLLSQPASLIHLFTNPTSIHTKVCSVLLICLFSFVTYVFHVLFSLPRIFFSSICYLVNFYSSVCFCAKTILLLERLFWFSKSGLMSHMCSPSPLYFLHHYPICAFSCIF